MHADGERVEPVAQDVGDYEKRIWQVAFKAVNDGPAGLPVDNALGRPANRLILQVIGLAYDLPTPQVFVVAW